jgi:hypothetical protein
MTQYFHNIFSVICRLEHSERMRICGHKNRRTLVLVRQPAKRNEDAVKYIPACTDQLVRPAVPMSSGVYRLL